MRKKRKRKASVLYVVEVDNGTGGWFPFDGSHSYYPAWGKKLVKQYRKNQPAGSRLVFRVARYVREER